MNQGPSVNKVIITSFVVDLLDVTSSLVVALLSGSVVMISQVLEGVADLAASGFLLIGLVRSKRPSDQKHPFGYGLELYFWTMLSSVLILGGASTLSIYLGWQRLVNHVAISNIYLALAVLGLTAVTNGYSLSLSIRRMLKGRSILRIREIFIRSSYIETKTSFVLDLVGTLASVFGFLALIVYRITGDLVFDAIGAMSVGGLLAVFGVILLIPLRELIIGQSASEETEGKIRKATRMQPEVKTVLGLKTLHIGPGKLLVNAEVNLNSNLTTHEIEDIVSRIKEDVKREVPEVKHVHVEIETA